VCEIFVKNFRNLEKSLF